MYRVVTFTRAFTVVTAQEGPGIRVIAHPGQDVEILCNPTKTSTMNMEGWLVNNVGPYRISSLRSGILTGYTAASDSNNLIVQNIIMNDSRNGSEYFCVIKEQESNPIFLYVAGECPYTAT